MDQPEQRAIKWVAAVVSVLLHDHLHWLWMGQHITFNAGCRW